MNTARGRQATWGVLLVVAVCASMITANCGKSGRIIKAGSGIYIASSASLHPDADPSPQKIGYAGTVIPVETKRSEENGTFTLGFWYQGVQLESEVYKSSDSEFDLVNAAGEEYSPPLPLLLFPMHAGDSWKWSGQMLTGPTGRKATAVVTTREDKVDIGTMADALVVEVDLSIDNGAPSPATRQLMFWLVKDKGVVKRDFGASTSRMPADAKEG